MYSVLHDIKVAFISNFWILPFLSFLLSINLLMYANAEEIETVHYLDICGIQVQMYQEFQALDGGIYKTDQNCILVNNVIDTVTNDSGILAQLISQYIISNQYFEITNDDIVIRPQYKVGYLYAVKIHDCYNADLCFIQNGSVLFDKSDSLIDSISEYYNADIEVLVYEESDNGSTNIDTEHAQVVEPEEPQEQVAESDPVVDEPEEPQEEIAERDPVIDEPEELQEEVVESDPVVDEPEEIKTEPIKKTTIVKSSGTTTQSSSKVSAAYTDSMEGTPVTSESTKEETDIADTSSTEQVMEEASESGDPLKESIDGEENVDNVTLHNDNVFLTIAIFVVGGIGVAMGLTHLML